MKRKWYLVLLIVTCWFTGRGLAEDRFVTLAVLEDVPGTHVGEPNQWGLRIVFRKSGQNWLPFPSKCVNQECLKKLHFNYPRAASWTISFDSRKLGVVRTQPPQPFDMYSHVGVERIVRDSSIPKVGERSSEYGGFTDAKVYRPLAASSHGYYRDPDTWKPSHPSPKLLELLRAKFRQKFPKLCKANEEEPLNPYQYSDQEVQVKKAYSSRKGWSIAQLHLSGAIDCNDVEAGFEMDDPWFVIRAAGAPAYLDKGIWLVDTGDYDNDGRSELLFSISRYNRGGYELFYDEFKKRSSFEFSYH